jgi:hypothetical protein
MVRILSRLGAVIAGVVLLATVHVGAASASAVTFGCRIAPGYTFTFEPACGNDKPATSYSVAFAVQNLSSGSHTFSWSITGDWTSVVTGCGPTDQYCTVATRGSSADREVQGRVTVDGSATFYAYAFISAYCGSYRC